MSGDLERLRQLTRQVDADGQVSEWWDVKVDRVAQRERAGGDPDALRPIEGHGPVGCFDDRCSLASERDVHAANV
jgi:hypothetical protein